MPREDTMLRRPDANGGVRMIEGSTREVTARAAVASGRVLLGEDAFREVERGTLDKGDALTTAQVAGIMGAKQTSTLIPLCQDVALKGVDLEFNLNDEEHSVDIRAYTRTFGSTGVQMEALMAVSIAALTIYDMCKSISREIRITDIHLLAKTGGQSGDYRKSSTSSEE